LNLVSGQRLGPFEIVGPLGAGGMGEVYKARDVRLDRPVALKVLPPEVVRDPERVRRFEGGLGEPVGASPSRPAAPDPMSRPVSILERLLTE